MVNSDGFVCPVSDCASDPCGPSDNEHCEIWNDLNPDECDACEDGYWAMTVSHECILCSTSIGCTHCRNFAGCLSCDSGGGDWQYATECESSSGGVNWCEGSTSLTNTGTSVTDDSTTNTDDTSTDGSDTISDDSGNAYDCSVIDCIYGDTAVAYFSTYNFEGSVTVTKGHIDVSISMKYFDFDDIDEYGGRSCFAGGIHYGIYEKWEHSTEISRLGDDLCGNDYVGMRWDPWLACSRLSHNKYCQHNGQCIDSGTRDGDGDDKTESLTDNMYSCDELNYQNDPFSCEIGDWSGKYGLLYYNSETKMLEGGGSSAYEVDSYDLTGKSIVFRCHDHTRLFCGKFIELKSNTNNKNDDETTTTPVSNTIMKPPQNGTYSKIAYLGDKSFVKLTYYHQYEISIDSTDVTMPGTCGNEIYYRIFTDYSDILSCSLGSGNFYDPTISCDENSHMQNVNDYCEDTQRCGVSNYFYSCNYSTNIFQRFKCGPGDLADKYGSIDISKSSSFIHNVSGYDSLMIPLSKLDGKSIVLQCSKNYAIIGCAPFEDYTADKGLYGTVIITNDGNGNDGSSDTSDNDNNDNKETNANSGNSTAILGISETAGYVLIAFVVLSIIPCVTHCKNRHNKNKDGSNSNGNRNGSGAVVTGAAAAQAAAGAVSGGIGASQSAAPSTITAPMTSMGSYHNSRPVTPRSRGHGGDRHSRQSSRQGSRHGYEYGNGNGNGVSTHGAGGASHSRDFANMSNHQYYNNATSVVDTVVYKDDINGNMSSYAGSGGGGGGGGGVHGTENSIRSTHSMHSMHSRHSTHSTPSLHNQYSNQSNQSNHSNYSNHRNRGNRSNHTHHSSHNSVHSAYSRHSSRNDRSHRGHHRHEHDNDNNYNYNDEDYDEQVTANTNLNASAPGASGITIYHRQHHHQNNSGVNTSVRVDLAGAKQLDLVRDDGNKYEYEAADGDIYYVDDNYNAYEADYNNYNDEYDYEYQDNNNNNENENENGIEQENVDENGHVGPAMISGIDEDYQHYTGSTHDLFGSRNDIIGKTSHVQSQQAPKMVNVPSNTITMTESQYQHQPNQFGMATYSSHQKSHSSVHNVEYEQEYEEEQAQAPRLTLNNQMSGSNMSRSNKY